MIGFGITSCVPFFCFSVIPPCNSPTTVENADIIGDKREVYNHGAAVTYACRTNYRMEGEGTITCQSGQWSPGTPTCISKCFFLMPLHTNLGFFALRQLRWYRWPGTVDVSITDSLSFSEPLFQMYLIRMISDYHICLHCYCALKIQQSSKWSSSDQRRTHAY